MVSAIDSLGVVVMGRSLRLKVTLVFSVLTIALLLAQALGVRTLAEAQEEKLICLLYTSDAADE